MDELRENTYTPFPLVDLDDMVSQSFSCNVMWLTLDELDWMPIFGSWQRVTVRLSCECALWEWPLRCWCSWWVPTGKVCYTVAWRCWGLDSFEAPSRIQWWLHLCKLLLYVNFVQFCRFEGFELLVAFITNGHMGWLFQESPKFNMWALTCNFFSPFRWWT